MYLADYCSDPPFEVIVKNFATGSTLRNYPGLFDEGYRFRSPVVKFDYRTDPEDLPIAEDYIREAGYDPLQFKEIALSVNKVLSACLSPNELWDFCIVIGRRTDGSYTITSEISPDCMRVRTVDGRSLDKDLFRWGATHSEILAAWTELVAGFSVD